MKTIVGMFNDAQNLEKALGRLHSQGIDDKAVKVVNMNLSNNTESISDNQVIPFSAKNNVSGVVNTQKNQNQNITPNDLVDMGIPNEQAEFFAHSLNQDSTLVIVEVDDEDYDLTLNTMYYAKAKNLTTK